MKAALENWERLQQYWIEVEECGLSMDVSRMRFGEGFLNEMAPRMEKAFAAMAELEAGGVANPDEGRMVGHYWLRTPELAPNDALREEIRSTLAHIETFVGDVHAGRIKPPTAERFTQVLSIGIGGSALGPMFVADALGRGADDAMRMYFLDNTDPEGMERVLAALEPKLNETLCLVISKSGGTPETRNGMVYAADAFRRRGLEFAKHAVAITGVGSNLDRIAEGEGWVARFPMWDWVGGRTSETSAVGLVPAALQGIDIRAMLEGAASCDAVTRRPEMRSNPAAMMALMWFHATEGRGAKDLVVLPYKDRLLLFSRYLQQLLMESLGKRLNLGGDRVDQGLSVYGNKGSTDQHAYVQQLRDGVNNFFVTFIRVLEAGGRDVEVEPGVSSGDFLHGFLLGTRAALNENDRESMVLTVRRIDARTVGVLIALWERAVGLYGFLIGVNAYHQPGVEAGKKAAASVLDLQQKVRRALSSEPKTAAQLAAMAEAPGEVELAFWVLEHLAANGAAARTSGGGPAERTYRIE